jgi:hypothetical protein
VKASLGVRALETAMGFLKMAIPMGLLMAGLDLLMGKFFDAKKAADDGDKAVAAMLSEKGDGGAAKEADKLAAQTKASTSEVDKLKASIGNAFGEELQGKQKEFLDRMRDLKAPTKDVETGLVALGTQAAKSLGVDVTQAANKVEQSFKDSNAALTVLITDLPNLAKEGINTGAVVGKAIAGMIDGAKSQAEINIIKTRLVELGQRGYQTGEQVADGMKVAADKGQKLKNDIATWGLGFADVGKAAGKAGVDIGELTSGVSKGFKDSVTDVDNLANSIKKGMEGAASSGTISINGVTSTIKTMGVAGETAQTQLAKALDQRLSSAKTEQEVGLVTAEFKKLGAEGLLTGDKLKEGLQKAQDKLDQIKPGINSLTEAFHQLGLKTPEELNKIAKANEAAWDKVSKDTRVSTADLQTAFKTYADSAMAANGGVATRTLDAKAAMLGLQITTDATGKSIVQAMDSGAKSVDGVAKSTQEATGYMDVFTRAAKEATAALEEKNAATEKGIAAQEKANDLVQRAIDLENKRLHIDSQGFSIDPKTGQRVVMTAQTDRTVYDNAKSQGLTDAQALQIVNQFMQNGAQVGWGGQTNGENWSTAVQKAIDAMVMKNARDKANAETSAGKTSAEKSTPSISTPSASTAPVATPAVTSTPSASTTHTVNVTIAGIGNTSINTASAGDSTALVDLITQLGRAKQTAG